MYNVLIFGTGNGYINMKENINSSIINILAFIDNNPNKIGETLEKISIISPNEIFNYDYDYIIIASSYYEQIESQLLKLNISKSKILNYYEYWNNVLLQCSKDIDSKVGFEILRGNIEKVKNINDYDGFITGLSYAFYGIDTKFLTRKFINFSLSGQDIFYDYSIAKHILSLKDNNYKYTIIALSYYSFHYDLSKSVNLDRCENIYKPILNELHNFEKSFANENEIEKLLNYGWASDIIKSYTNMDVYEQWKNTKFIQYDIERRKQLGKERAKKDSKKNYPQTVEENKKVLKDYLNLLYKYDIMPIIVILPVTRWYRDEFSTIIKEEFYDIIFELKKKNKFNFLDYFSHKFFSDEDFFDESHLNKNGAKKLTILLNKYIG